MFWNVFKSWAVLFVIGWPLFLQAQLINIESKRMHTDTVRAVFRGDLSTAFTDNNGKDIFTFRGSLTTQLKSKNRKNIYFFTGDYNRIRSGGADILNNWFFHLRYNQQWNETLRFESYLQWQRNSVLDVNRRYLVGAGLRLKLIDRPHMNLYLGQAYMYEIEQNDELGQEFYFHRHSAYLSASFSFPESSISISNTLYFQPLYQNFSDYRILEQFKLEVPIVKKLLVFALIDYFYDRITPKGRKQFSSVNSFGLSIRL